MDINPQSRPALAARVRLQTDRVTGEPVLLYPEGLLELNPGAQAIAARCNGTATVAGIVAALGAEYEVDAAELQADVLACLEDLHSRQLLVFTTP